MAATMHELLQIMIERGASDLHITTGTFPLHARRRKKYMDGSCTARDYVEDIANGGNRPVWIGVLD